MSLNGSGIYLVNSAGQPVVANTLITAAAFNAFTADIATALSTAVFKDGQQTITANLPMGGYRLTGLGAGSSAGQSLRYEQLFTTGALQLLGALDQVTGAAVASAGTINLTTATGNGLHITGTTTITAVTLGSGMWRLVIFDDALTLTHHATTNNLPTGANITTAAGDRAIYWSDGTTVYCVMYSRASGAPAGAAGTGANTFTGTQTIESTDAGATAGPDLVLYRNSATPAASDLIGRVVLNGEDSAGNTETYGVMQGEIVDPTSTSEDSQVSWWTVIAGTLARRFRVGAGLFMEGATGGDQGANTINAAAVYDDGVQINPLVIGTALSTNTATLEFTGIAATATRITINFSGLSTNGTSPWIIQIGDSGGYDTAGYASAAGAATPVQAGDGFLIHESPTAALSYARRVVLERIDSTGLDWVGSSILLDVSSGSTSPRIGSGINSTLTTRLDRIRWTTQGGANVRDSGSVNITVE